MLRDVWESISPGTRLCVVGRRMVRLTRFPCDGASVVHSRKVSADGCQTQFAVDCNSAKLPKFGTHRVNG
jgi:hypothetical protein